jgi:hypothetical protein
MIISSRHRVLPFSAADLGRGSRLGLFLSLFHGCEAA